MELLIAAISSVISLALGGWIAWHFTKKTYYAQVENQISLNEKLVILCDREKMLETLYTMYDKANAGDIIWGQSVSGNILGDVTRRVVVAAQHGVEFEMIFSEDALKDTSLKKEVVLLFQQLNNARVHIRNDNNIRIQGLSTKEILIALPSNTKYVSVLIKDEAIVSVFRNWFSSRFNTQEEG